MTVSGNQRGVALIITLLVVALLTIIVVEFTFSAQVDMHMARNTLTGLQASLLARSGVNMGEAFLLHDDDPKVDSFVEPWCPAMGPDAQSCLIDASSADLAIPPNMQLRVQILDEGSKLNLNLLRPQNLAEWQRFRANPDDDPRLKAMREIYGRLFAAQNVPAELVDAAIEYWGKIVEMNAGNLPAGGASGPAGPSGAGGLGGGRQGLAPSPALASQQDWLLDLPSLDDAGVIPGFTPAVIKRLRPVMTAYAMRPGSMRGANLNTVPRRILNGISGEGGSIDSVIERRQEAPITEAEKGPLVQQSFDTSQNPALAPWLSRFTVTSSLFLIRASAIVNANPLTGRGGIGRSVSMLVRRDRKPGVAPDAPPGTPRWILTRLDWHKEGGAVLFQDDALDVDGGGQGLAAGDVLN